MLESSNCSQLLLQINFSNITLDTSSYSTFSTTKNKLKLLTSASTSKSSISWFRGTTFVTLLPPCKVHVATRTVCVCVCAGKKNDIDILYNQNKQWPNKRLLYMNFFFFFLTTQKPKFLQTCWDKASLLP